MVFILNSILNIQKFKNDFCECREDTICYPCFMSKILNEQEVYQVYERCLDLDFLVCFNEQLYEHLFKLFKLKNHFLCEIIHEQFRYIHKCFFTGYNISIKYLLKLLMKNGSL